MAKVGGNSPGCRTWSSPWECCSNALRLRAPPDSRSYLVEAAELWRRLTLERDIKIELETEDIEVAPAKAAPLSLILHELMTNCCEHAFPKECGGTVRIAFRHATEACAELAVSDDGVGLPPQEPIRQSFGLSVVGGLAAQLGGTFSVGSNSPGAIARVEFPLSETTEAGSATN